MCLREGWNVLKHWTKEYKKYLFLIRQFLKHWTKWNKKSIFKLFLSLMWHLRIFKFFLYRMRYLVEFHVFSHEVFTYIYILIPLSLMPFVPASIPLHLESAHCNASQDHQVLWPRTIDDLCTRYIEIVN